MYDQEQLLQALIQLLYNNPGQLQPMEGLLAGNSGIGIQTIRAMKESGLLDTTQSQPAQTNQPTYDPKRGQEYYDQRPRRHPGTGRPMSEEEYQKMLRSIPKR